MSARSPRVASIASLDNAASVVHFAHSLGIAWEATIQSVAAGSQVLQDVVNAIYIYGRWSVLIAAGFLLYRFRRDQNYTLRNVCLLTGALGLFIFALYPGAPPRLTDLPLAMAFAVIATANHFVIDVIVGVALVKIGLGLRRTVVVPRRFDVTFSGRWRVQ